MSISVQNLTKQYGSQSAVSDLSFEARKGEIIGFLGPNGAGKTTTMKILTCFIPQTSGAASVCGFDTQKNATQVRERVGYLPEHNPLYKDMYVKEYLTFVGDLHRIKNVKNRVAEMIARTGLTAEQNKIIGTLSKGYRQRVGLAQAMIHNPDVLILDEPTTGLDPNQLVEIRNLIRELAAEKTVILSTHIMQEVEALCHRAIIISQGQLVANDTIEGLRQHAQTETIVTVEFLEAITKQALAALTNATKITQLSDTKWQIYTPSTLDIRAELAAFATQNKLTLVGISREQSSIQDVFASLTQN